MSSLKLANVLIIFIFIFQIVTEGNAQDKNKKQVTSFKIAVLNLEAIRRQATVIKGIHDQISKLEKGIREAIQVEEEALRAANQDLAKKRAILAPEAYTKERKIFEQSVSKVQKMVQQKKQLLSRAKRNALGQVENKLNRLVAALAKEKGFLLVLRTDQTILASRKLDITSIILDRLNKSISNLKVEIPKN